MGEGRDLEVRFVASEGSGSHGTLYAGDCRMTVKDRKKEIGKGLPQQDARRPRNRQGRFLGSETTEMPRVEERPYA